MKSNTVMLGNVLGQCCQIGLTTSSSFRAENLPNHHKHTQILNFHLTMSFLNVFTALQCPEHRVATESLLNSVLQL